MDRTCTRWAAALAAAVLIAAPPALAQRGRGGGAPRGGGGQGSSAPAPEAGKPQEIWPRLDTGAFLCATLDDLRRHAAEMADPGGGPGPRADCRLVQKMTPITILSRSGPGATEVQLKPNGPTGWTNTYLPDKGPVTARAGAPPSR